MADFTLVALKDEIVNDPDTLGYKEAGGDWKGDQVIADLISDRSTGPLVGDKISGAALWATAELSEHQALSAEDERIFNAICSSAEVDLSITHIRGKLRGTNGSLFLDSSTTASRINAYVHKISQAEKLWGEGTNVTASQVGHAQNLV